MGDFAGRIEGDKEIVGDYDDIIEGDDENAPSDFNGGIVYEDEHVGDCDGGTVDEDENVGQNDDEDDCKSEIYCDIGIDSNENSDDEVDFENSDDEDDFSDIDDNEYLLGGMTVKLTKDEIMMLIVSFFVRYNLTKGALVDLLKVINAIFDFKILPETHYKFTKYFNNILKCTRQYYCLKCKLFLGELTLFEQKTVICENCNSTSKKYFITNSVSEYVQDIVSNNLEAITQYSKQLNNNFLQDISQGSCIKDMQKYFGKFYSISFNTDGIATFKSNVKKSLWPIIVTLNELPPHLRFLKKNIIIAGLWLDSESPPMELFLKPFCNELKRLFHEGISIKNNIFKIICTTGCADSVARCKLLNSKQFNGKFGCTYCKHPGVLVKIGGSKQLRFLSDTDGEIRTISVTLKEMKEAELLRKPICGIKGFSILTSIPKFNIIFGLPVDIMHGVFLGVAKGLSELWFDQKHHRKPFYLGNKTNKVDDILVEYHPYSEISRYPRQISQRHNWKANEWMNWMLYFALPSLIDILPQQFLEHFLILVSTISRLLRDNIDHKTLDKCEKDLREFVINYETLYGVKKMVYNVHLLLHVVDCVRHFGPLWGFSLFPYENMNGFLKDCIKGPKEPLLQINNKYLIYNKVHNGSFSSGCIRKSVNELCAKMLSSGIRYNKQYHSTYISIKKIELI